MLASRACAVQMLLLAFCFLMCCSRGCRARRYMGRPWASLQHGRTDRGQQGVQVRWCSPRGRALCDHVAAIHSTTQQHTTPHSHLASHSHLACTESQRPASVHTLTLSSPPSVLGAASGVHSSQRKTQHAAPRTLGARQTAASSPDICLLQLPRVALTRTVPADRLRQQRGPAETAL